MKIGIEIKNPSNRAVDANVLVERIEPSFGDAPGMGVHRTLGIEIIYHTQEGFENALKAVVEVIRAENNQ